MSTPRVSVLTPAFNAAATLRESVASIQAQTFEDLEILVVDDGSTDATLDVAHAVAAGDPRVRVLQNPENVGIAASRNRCVAEASADLVAWQDADDISMPRRIEQQLAVLDDDPRVGMVGGFLLFFGAGPPSVRRYAADDASIRAQIFRHSPVAQPAAMVRRAALEAAGPYSSRFEPAEDLDMAFRIGVDAHFANVQDVVLRYRESTTSATARRLRKIEQDTLRIRWAARKLGYRMTAGDLAYNVAQALTMPMPPAARLALFKRIRNGEPTSAEDPR